MPEASWWFHRGIVWVLWRYHGKNIGRIWKKGHIFIGILGKSWDVIRWEHHTHATHVLQLEKRRWMNATRDDHSEWDTISIVSKTSLEWSNDILKGEEHAFGSISYTNVEVVKPKGVPKPPHQPVIPCVRIHCVEGDWVRWFIRNSQ